MQDVWFSQGFEGFLLNRVCVHTGHRSTRWQTHRALVECWFSIGFTRYSVQIRVCPTVGGSSRARRTITMIGGEWIGIGVLVFSGVSKVVVLGDRPKRPLTRSLKGSSAWWHTHTDTGAVV